MSETGASSKSQARHAEAVLSVVGLSAEIGPGVSLQNVDFEIATGNITAVIGPNGAGKTSLLRAICGDLPLSSGSVSYCGKAMTQWANADKATLLAILPQRSTLEFPFTVREVVGLGRIPHSTSFARNAEIVEAALDMVDCGKFAERFYTNLSGGEKQRVQLARVAAQIWEEQESAHRCLILDEPTSSLDLAHQAMVLEMVRFFAAQNVAVLTVLHDLNIASKIADQILVLNDGEVAALGSPQSILTENLLRSVFNIDAIVSTNAADGSKLVIT